MIKLPSVSISKIGTYRAFPIDLITHWSLVTLLFSSSTYVITCIERSHKLKEHIDVMRSQQRVGLWLGAIRQQAIIWPIVKQVHDAISVASLCLKWVQYLSYIIDIKLVDGLVLSVLWLSAGMALDKLILNNFPSLNGKIEIHDSQCNLRC